MGSGTLLVALNDLPISGFISLKTNTGLFSREADRLSIMPTGLINVYGPSEQVLWTCYR